MVGVDGGHPEPELAAAEFPVGEIQPAVEVLQTWLGGEGAESPLLQSGHVPHTNIPLVHTVRPGLHLGQGPRHCHYPASQPVSQSVRRGQELLGVTAHLSAEIFTSGAESRLCFHAGLYHRQPASADTNNLDKKHIKKLFIPSSGRISTGLKYGDLMRDFHEKLCQI